MSDIKIFWDPHGFELDSLGKIRHISPPTDGDTPYVRMPIRMLSIDTPELHYPGNSKPSNSDDKLKQLANWIQQGKAPVNDDLGQYLHPKLDTGTAGTLQEQQGEEAKKAFIDLLELKLTKPNGKKRNVFLYAADEHFDSNNRLLAYMSPSYTSKELQNMSRHDRATFNLLLVESGWAATFVLYPSLPRNEDLKMLYDGAKNAVENDLGAWADPLLLTGYEFRMCIKLYNVTKKLEAGEKLSSREKYGWIERYVADMTTLEIYEPQKYFMIEPHKRIFIWAKDVRKAVSDLNLIPGD